MTKRAVSALCALALALPVPAALAAPTRQGRTMEIQEDEGLRGFLSTVMSAAVLRDLPALEEGEAPGAELAEAVFGVFEYNMFGLDSVTLTESECAGLYSGIFASGAFRMPEEGSCPCVKIEDGKMVMDLSELNETPLVGACVYESRIADGRVFMKADLYTAWGYYMTDPGYIPEEDLTWYCSAEICAEAGEGELFGWKLVSYRLGSVWQDGALSEWKEYTDEESAWSVSLPSMFGESSAGGGLREWQTADGSATLRAEFLPPMSVFTESGTNEGLYGTITQEGDGRLKLVFCGEGLEADCVLTLEFPPDRLDEYSYYLEIIRNSFWMRGMPYG
ncbi:MAG: hypothetical protein IKI84_03465 [Clostridia bacterium]|nr:hypothetical protein [Clostridia bacterium]